MTLIEDIHAAIEPRTERRIIAANRIITAINANHAALDVALATIARRRTRSWRSGARSTSRAPPTPARAS